MSPGKSLNLACHTRLSRTQMWFKYMKAALWVKWASSVLTHFWSIIFKFCVCNVYSQCLPICLYSKMLLSYLFFMVHVRLYIFHLTFPYSHPSLPVEVLSTLQVLGPSRNIFIIIFEICIHSFGLSYTSLICSYFCVLAPQLDLSGKDWVFPPLVSI